MIIAGVRILDIPYHADKIYEYYVRPDDEAQMRTISPGRLAMVPFGGGNRGSAALVCSVREGEKEITEGDRRVKLKPIISLINDELTLDEELIRLCGFIAERTFCSFGDAVRAVLPITSFGKLRTSYLAGKTEPEDELSSEVRRIAARKNGVEVRELGRELEKLGRTLSESDLERLISRLTASGALEKSVCFDEKLNRAFVRRASLACDADDYIAGRKKLRSQKQLDIITALHNAEADGIDGIEVLELERRLSVTSAQLKTLADRGMIRITAEEKLRTPYSELVVHGNKCETKSLSDEQRAAADKLVTMLESGKAGAALLHGVTGSGKTHVIEAAVSAALKLGRQAIILVPEIALTPQTVGFFTAAFGSRVAVIHSSLSQGERFDAWRRIRRGEVDVCIGTRSAVFAPFKRLGLIVIDEEQEHTYKSDMNPKYHARDIARFRCAENSAVMLLASATPSLESYYKAQSGIYTLLELKNRYGGAVLPKAVLSDLRTDAASGNMAAIGTELSAELTHCLESGRQAVLFINRRGYNNFVSCPLCGGTVKCPHCSVSMTYHMYTRRTGGRGGYLVCHYCGHRETVPEKCPECGSDKLIYNGFGTQKVEDELAERFPEARILRMDADTTQTKFASDRIIEKFRSGDADILLGTQMVTKGHDFENVTLVGVVNADSSLYIDDYRASERTFSLVTQVAGRAGRGKYEGTALIQTYSPDNPTLKFAVAQDYRTFYDNEIRIRRTLVFPPFCDICLVTFSDTDELKVQRDAVDFSDEIKRMTARSGEFESLKLVMYGPFEAPIYRLNEKFRMRLVIKCRDCKETRKLFSMLLRSFKNGAAVSIDMNPNNI